jgi:hypothetical protein
MAITDPVLPLADALLACLCAAVADTGNPVCACCVHPGLSTPMDYCDCECSSGGNGQAWVRVNRIYPAGARFPQQSFEVEPCKIPSWGVELVMGVYRCVATLDDDGRPPTCDQVEADATKILLDAAAMRVAAVCCFGTAEEDRTAIVGEWSPIGPNGGCAGGFMSVTVQFYDCCPPVP